MVVRFGSEDGNGLHKDYSLQQTGFLINYASHHAPSLHAPNLPIHLHPLPHPTNSPSKGPRTLRPHTLRGPTRVAPVPRRRPFPPPHQGPLLPPLLPPLRRRRPLRRPLHPPRPPRQRHPLPPLRGPPPLRHHPLRLRHPLRLLPPPALPRCPRLLLLRQAPPPRLRVRPRGLPHGRHERCPRGLRRRREVRLGRHSGRIRSDGGEPGMRVGPVGSVRTGVEPDRVEGGAVVGG